MIASWEISPIAAVSAAAYDSAVHVSVPLPNLNLLVFVSTPISPAANTGFAAVHSEAKPLRT